MPQLHEHALETSECDTAPRAKGRRDPNHEASISQVDDGPSPYRYPKSNENEQSCPTPTTLKEDLRDAYYKFLQCPQRAVCVWL